MPWWKPEKWSKVKARRKGAEAAARAACLDLVWARHGGRCGRCGRVVKRCGVDPDWTEYNAGHSHDIISRSLGGDPGDPLNQELLCVRHHAEAHGLKVAGRPA
jgi:hypothetical protein